MIDLPTDLPADLVPLSWLLGVWEGTGVIDYEAGDVSFSGEFAHRVSFSHDGGDYVNYAASAWFVADDETRAPLVAETGYWRLARPLGQADPGPALLPPSAVRDAGRTADDVESLRNQEGGFDLEVAIVHSDGISELYVGQVRGPRIDLATDAVVRPASAKVYTAATRMYGLVDGHLLWAWDIAALGGELGSHASARLARAE
ncbi:MULTISPECIES: FABP family protein [unclassified Microbacterium]|uniref:FABP family protein n=1 Tax=unclassified Microbacterium TaxID=2609290 RepID=UPI000DD16989|nr:FABP family protein [Microbacterium sp. PM5]AXA95141.1 FABP family protein [Microbacterium sp. PM5]